MWNSVLELGPERAVRSGSAEALAAAIRRGADLQIYTEFRHNEHIDVHSDNAELVREASDFRVTYLLEDHWVAGIMNLRQPISPPDGFGPRPSMSFFLYNQDGSQAIARPYLDRREANGEIGPSAVSAPETMPKYHPLDNWDTGTNAPSSNFIYKFECYRFLVDDSWREVFAHDADGEVQSGSLDELVQVFQSGCDMKVAVRNLGAGLAGNEPIPEHEVFVHIGPRYFNTERRLFSAGSQPLVRVRPTIPLRYESRNWDFGWLMVRSDGYVEYRCCDPYSLVFTDQGGRHALRWFAR